MASASKKKADLKVVILGDADVGKTTLIHRYLEGTFQAQISTIGASFSLKQWGSYNIAIWDTAGQEKFSGLSSFYCRGAGAAIMTFDLSNEDSFNALRARFETLLQAAEPDCLVVVVGTKRDLVVDRSNESQQQDARRLALHLNKKSLNQVPYFETSSKTGHNVDRVFDYIFETTLGPCESSGGKRKSRPDTVVLDGNSHPVAGTAKGCC